MEGFIIKCISNDYHVYCSQDNKVYVAKAKGNFKNQNINPLCGDNVIFDYDKDANFALITSILPRKNAMIRPSIANVDLGLIVMSCIDPVYDAYLVDKLIVNLYLNNIEPVLVINKCEHITTEIERILDNYILAGYQVIKVSAKNNINIDKLHDIIKDKKVVLCGQSAVGKSSLINVLTGNDNIKIGSYSTKLGRGRHETRVTEYMHYNDTFIADSPGFSSLEIKEDLTIVARAFKDFDKYSCNCRFNTCIHKNEPNCAIKEAVNKGIILKERYDNYIHLLNEIKDGKKVWVKK